MNQPKDRADGRGLLQNLYCLLAVAQLLITGQQRRSVLAAGAERGTASSKTYIPALQPAETIQGEFQVLGQEPRIPALRFPHGMGKHLHPQTLTPLQGATGKVPKLGSFLCTGLRSQFMLA